MNWQKYSIDEWLEQFGIWCNQCTIKGGNLPDGLHANQIYYLMRQVEPMPTKPSVICEISDDEALAVNNLLCQAFELLGADIEMMIANKVHGRGLRTLAEYYGLSFKQVNIAVNNARYYLAGCVKTRP